MAQKRVITNEIMGKLAFLQLEIFRRVKEGELDPELVIYYLEEWMPRLIKGSDYTKTLGDDTNSPEEKPKYGLIQFLKDVFN